MTRVIGYGTFEPPAPQSPTRESCSSTSASSPVGKVARRGLEYKHILTGNISQFQNDRVQKVPYIRDGEDVKIFLSSIKPKNRLASYKKLKDVATAAVLANRISKGGKVAGALFILAIGVAFIAAAVLTGGVALFIPGALIAAAGLALTAKQIAACTKGIENDEVIRTKGGTVKIAAEAFSSLRRFKIPEYRKALQEAALRAKFAKQEAEKRAEFFHLNS